MFVLIQVEVNTSPTFSRAVGLVGTYNSYSQADDAMSDLFEFFEDKFESKSFGEMEAHLKDDVWGEFSWYIFDADAPEWFRE